MIRDKIHKLVGKNGHDIWLDGKKLGHKKSCKVINHSPTGFAWGYGGSGPAQLALAILLELLPKDFALRHYQGFKWDVIARIEDKEQFELEFEMPIIN